MRKFSYWLCFSLVAIPFGIGLVGWLLSKFYIALPAMGLVSLLSSFSSLIPRILAPMFPTFISVALNLVMLIFVLRRTWLLFAKNEGVPTSFEGTAKVLAYIGSWSFILALIVLIASIALHAGTGVPAGMLLLPAAFCVPWAFFLTEVLSLRAVKKTDVQVRVSARKQR